MSALVAVVSFAYALQTSAGTYQTGVFAKTYGSGTFIELSSSYQTLISMSLPNVPITAYYYVVCDGYANINGSPEFAIGVDSTAEDASTRRFYTNTTGIHTERVYKLGPGAHSFYFIGRMYMGQGSAKVNYHTITVTIFTDGSLTQLAGTADAGLGVDEMG